VEIGYYYEKTRARNEALDLKVYNLAAMTLLNPHFEKLAEKLRIVIPQLDLVSEADEREEPQPVAAGQQDSAPEPPERAPFVTRYNPPRRRGSNFVKGWR
jgi:phage terminase large subunit GpA-like protein